MSPIIDKVKEKALKLPDEIKNALADAGKEVKTLNLRVIGYKDIEVDGNKAFEYEEDFTESGDGFESSIRRLVADGGGDEPESTLDAILKAINSDWKTQPEQIKCRRIIIVFTDASSKPLHPSSVEGKRMSLDESIHYILTKLRNMPVKNEARLIIFGKKDVETYSKITNAMDYAEYIEVESGVGLKDVDMKDVYGMIVKSFTMGD